MGKIRSFRSIIARVIIGAAVLIFAATSWADDNTTGDLTQNIEITAAAGILKFRGRNETQFRDLRPGTAQMASGSFLKTGNGPADILFENDTVLCLAANTEVEVGIYHNGIWICQYSGRAYHSHETSANNIHIAQTAFYTVRAIGTEYRTTLNFPVEGAVTVEWGELGVIAPRMVSPQTGTEFPELRVFVPQGHKIVAPIHEDIITTDPGTRIYRPDQSNKVIRGEKVVRQPNRDDWDRSRPELCRTIRNLRAARARGEINRNQLRQKILSALGIDPDIQPRRPTDTAEGGLWIGSINNLLIKLCISGNSINDVKIVDFWTGIDKETHEVSGIRVNFSLSQGTHFIIERGGRVSGTYTIGDDRDIWKGATVDMWGNIGSRTGWLWVFVYSETDVATYQGSYECVDIRLVDPRGCDY